MITVHLPTFVHTVHLLIDGDLFPLRKIMFHEVIARRKYIPTIYAINCLPYRIRFNHVCKLTSYAHGSQLFLTIKNKIQILLKG